MNKMEAMLLEEHSELEHWCRLEFIHPSTHHRLTSICCTIGKSSQSVEMMMQMMIAGMNMVRLNMSHDSQEFHLQSIKNVREAAAQYSEQLGYTYAVAIALDLKGQEIRTGIIDGRSVLDLRKNDTLRLSTNLELLEKGNKDVVYVDYPNIINQVLPGYTIFVDDGAIVLIVKEIAVDCVICNVEVGGPLGSHKNVILPGIRVDLPLVSAKDNFDLKMGVQNNVDFVIASCVRSASSITEIRRILGEKGKDIKVLCKIDNEQGLEEMDNIITLADGIVVARADIGIQLPVEKVFLVQKVVIARCNRAGKPVMCASQILDSMNNRPRPTRAEVSDLANAILDGADVIMLSSETAIGPYPVDCVSVLHNTAREAECALWYRHFFKELLKRNPSAVDAAHAVAISAVDASRKALSSAIVVLTTSGRSAHLLSRYRPRCPILALTRCSRSARQAHLYRGIIPIFYTDTPHNEWLHEIESRIQYALHTGKKLGIVKAGDSIVMVTPWKDGTGFTNNMRIAYAFFENESFECMFKADKKMDQSISKPPR